MLTFVRDADELEWYVPAAILPSDLKISLKMIDQFLENPLDLEGKKAAQLLRKKARRRARRRAPSSEIESEIDDEDQTKRQARKKKEEVQYKSAQFIEDSDAELGDDEEFFRKEAALRAKTAMAAAEGRNATMKATGTKKRKKQKEAEGREKKKWKGGIIAPSADSIKEDGSDSDVDDPVNGILQRRSSVSTTTHSDQSAQPHLNPTFESNESSGVVSLRDHGEPHIAIEIDATQTHPTPKPMSGQPSPVERISDEEGDRRLGRRRYTKILSLSDEEDQ